MLLINFLKVSGKVDFLVNGASEEMRTTKSGFSKVKDVSDLMSGDPVNEHLEQIEEKDNEKSIIKRVHIPGSNTYSRKRERQAIQMQNQRMYEKLQNAKPTVSNTDWSAHTARYQQLKRNIQGMRYKSPGKGGSLFPTFNSANLQAAQRHRDASVPRRGPTRVSRSTPLSATGSTTCALPRTSPASPSIQTSLNPFSTSSPKMKKRKRKKLRK